MEPRPIFADDVFFVSYPRSGSAWLRRLVAIALYPQHSETVYRSINDVIPDMYAVGERLAQYPRPRKIKSHEPYHPLYPKVVYLYRDARDVMPSYYNFYQTIKGFDGTLDEFVGLFLKGRVDFGRWDDHIRSWFHGGRPDSFFSVSYEQLSEDANSALSSVLAFLGKSAPAEIVAKAVAECSFDRHQLLVKASSPHYSKGYRGGISGKPGHGRQCLSDRHLSALWDTMGETLEFLQYRR